MYTTSQQVLAGMGRHRRGLRGMGANAAATGAAIGTVIPGVGTVAGGIVGEATSLISSLFGGGDTTPHGAGTIQTPIGTLSYTMVLNDSTGGAQNVFAGWAKDGQHLAWVQQIASTGTGPKWNAPSATQTYGSADVAFAKQLIAAYTGAVVGSTPTTVFSTAGVTQTLSTVTAGITSNPLLLVGIAAGLAFMASRKGGRRR